MTPNELQDFLTLSYEKNGYTLNAANEIEGFLCSRVPTPSGTITRRGSSTT
jgi:hypothetical protein